ncbi:hypothetical protein NDU88_002690 [Pleurodeles waltl]|uniref:Uncharacterized protein n=1 Tax=Pleurodeles waltl TaxID=8319 RepID=A0AAV7NJC1_PLEWA|nr:hypothetical protein NDU88_002690 [Pleurodeles waltl]
MKARVMGSQERNKLRYDNRKEVKNINVKRGDWVVVKKCGVVRKGKSKFCEPQKVAKVINSVVKLDDGKEWSVGNLCKVNQVGVFGLDLGTEVSGLGLGSGGAGPGLGSGGLGLALEVERAGMGLGLAGGVVDVTGAEVAGGGGAL